MSDCWMMLRENWVVEKSRTKMLGDYDPEKLIRTPRLDQQGRIPFVAASLVILLTARSWECRVDGVGAARVVSVSV